jgi:hypothetical protein
VLLGCGLRRAELTAINLSDFEQRNGHFLLNCRQTLRISGEKRAVLPERGALM